MLANAIKTLLPDFGTTAPINVVAAIRRSGGRGALTHQPSDHDQWRRPARHALRAL